MNGITKRCISFAQGNKDPYQRVNYPFGLVLGVDEFVDEQCYFLEKEYMHNRALHGCGTVSGLHVTVDEEAGDIEARVSPGIGIDQYGRLFVVNTRQCASLPAWINEQELDAGEQTIYVVARYSECETELVPIAGQPCSSSEQLSAPSRIKDSFEIDFALEPPPHAAHQSVLNLAEFLHRLRRDPSAEGGLNLGSVQVLNRIIGPASIALPAEEFRVQLNTVIQELTGTEGERLLRILPLAIQPILDDIFTYWVTQVRPTISPSLLDPSQPESSDDPPPPAEILLAEIDVNLLNGGELIAENATVDNSTRPYLLHTQLIQELFDVQDLAGEGGVAAPARPLREFATIKDAVPNDLLPDTNRTRLLSLWVHLPDITLVDGEGLRLFRIGANGSPNPIQFNLVERGPATQDGGHRFVVETQTRLNNSDHLLFEFNTDVITVPSEDERQPLTEFLDAAPFAFANYQPVQARILAYHIVERAEIIEPLAPQPRVPFVTITPFIVQQGDNEDFLQYELWFHLDGFVEQNNGQITLGEQNVFLYVEFLSGPAIRMQIALTQVRQNVWHVIPEAPLGDLTQEEQVEFRQLRFSLARFVFPLEEEMEIIAFSPRERALNDFSSLQEYIVSTNQQPEGHRMISEEFGDTLVKYVRGQNPIERRVG